MSKILISDGLRDLIRAKNYQPTDEQFAELNAVYYLITKKYTKKGRTVPGRCPSGACLHDVYKSIQNYMDHYEHRVPSKEPRATKTVTVSAPSNFTDETPSINEELEATRAIWQDIFGKKPHHAKKLATLQQEIEEYEKNQE